MRICDACEKSKARRLLKVKDMIYGKGFVEYDLCEKCWQQIMTSTIKPLKGPHL